MTHDTEAIRRWATAHAATLAPAADAGPEPAAAPCHPREPAPCTVTSVTEIHTWRQGGNSIGWTLRWICTEEGRLLLAIANDSETVTIHDAVTGQVLHTLTGHHGNVERVEPGRGPDGRLLLATGSYDSSSGGSAKIWDPADGRCLHTFTGHAHDSAVVVAWGADSAGSPALITGDDGTVRFWDPATGAKLHEFQATTNTADSADSGIIHAMEWATGPNEQPRLAIIHYGFRGAERMLLSIRNPDSGQLLLTVPIGDRIGRTSVAYGHLADGRLALATAGRCSDSAPFTPVRVWTEDDQGEFSSQDLPEAEPNRVYEVRWAPLDDGRALLAAASNNGDIHLWDGHDLRPLPTGQAGHPRGWDALDWARTPDGRLLLATVSRDGEVQIFEVTLDPPVTPLPAVPYASVAGIEDAPTVPLRPVPRAPKPPKTSPAPNLAPTLRGHPATRQMLRLGTDGLWLPLGLLTNLIALTAAEQSANRPFANRAEALAGEPGIQRLRDLAVGTPAWDDDARTAFAAMLAAGLDIPDRYTPPDGTDPAALSPSLARALSDPRRTTGGTWHAPLTDLREAASGISDQLITLLTILGPRACAANPLLPLRLSRHVPLLPVMSPRELRFLAETAGRRDGARPTAATGTPVHSPGTAGVARTGPLSRLLPTQLALPPGLRSARLAENQLLYRQHRAPAPPAPQPVTLILDTSPPTFGPAGTALRLAAHHLVTTLWAYGHYPALITLQDPDAAVELRATADLIRIWTAATLNPPAPALATARRTAAPLGRPTLFLTHHQTVRDSGYRPRPATRLLTTHQPPENPPPPPAGPWHAHLPPDPTPEQLVTTVNTLLFRSADERILQSVPRDS